MSIDVGTRDPQPATIGRGAYVVGYDGSPSAFAAVRRALSLAAGEHRDVRVVLAWHVPITFQGYPLAGWSPEEDAQAILLALTTTLFPTGAPSTFSAVSMQGNAASVLIAESVGAEMLLVGSRGHGGFAGLLLGSVSSACAERAACPVLVMRGHEATSHDVVGPVLADVAV